MARYKAENLSPNAMPWNLAYKNDAAYLPENIAEFAVLDKAHDDQKHRTVTIKQYAKSAMTSNESNARAWYIDWDHEENWENPLMGYVSGADPMNQVLKQMRFDTPEQAVAFCKKRGWTYEVGPADTDVQTEFGITQYEHNFFSKAAQVDVRTRGRKCELYHRSAAGASHYFRPLNFHGTDKVEQHGPNGKAKTAPDAESYYKRR
eukprot:CAMPEP_0113309766 /NCGR_PEP_ID=MMETSP0010_2-20120614/7677_1 /TAXON_ID=216773 ORGANISM="Corethron hystrix, Strain 308" /NCGR_SAMPLE_ID=MMETSP0010_2 /ASSEMBLY_ACC=CAM_ASM_000155 /LENGTH=204 /DNA_ID=CAMNT_0000165081 /DNA_START=249 /DNA_END=863 /DNA_ORIENTATION=+ /assembly_acc=CAM_ASM_000155